MVAGPAIELSPLPAAHAGLARVLAAGGAERQIRLANGWDARLADRDRERGKEREWKGERSTWGRRHRCSLPAELASRCGQTRPPGLLLNPEVPEWFR